MRGFVSNFSRQVHSSLHGPVTVRHPERIMRCFSPEKLPVLTSLAREFAVCDHWFSSVPGPTWPNRFFMHAATSGGHLSDHPLIAQTIYHRLDRAKRSWKLYYHDSCQTMAILNLWGSALFRRRFNGITRFFEEAKAGDLPSYSFIEPRYHNTFDASGRLVYHANDQHPPYYPGSTSDIRYGEHLIADIYEALRSSPCWNKTLLVIVYDEHGGLYDHVVPPAGIPSPGHRGAITAGDFNFDRLGVRVPAVLVSPWIRRGTVDRTLYDHTSILATLERLWAMEPLTERDGHAMDLSPAFTLDRCRTDTLRLLPRPVLDQERQAEFFNPTPAALIRSTLGTAFDHYATKAIQRFSGLKHRSFHLRPPVLTTLKIE
jgi:phospholipase C